MACVCVGKWFAYVFTLKVINQGKVLVLDLYLQSIEIQNLTQVNMKKTLVHAGWICESKSSLLRQG